MEPFRMAGPGTLESELPSSPSLKYTVRVGDARLNTDSDDPLR
jgi:hypothetical protein